MSIDHERTFLATPERQIQTTQFVYEFMRTEKPVKDPVIQDAFFWMKDIQVAYNLFLQLTTTISHLPEPGLSAYFFHTMSAKHGRNSFAGYTARKRLSPSSIQELENNLPYEDTSTLLLPEIPPYIAQEINRYAGANQINLSKNELVHQHNIPELPPRHQPLPPQRFWRKFWRQ